MSQSASSIPKLARVLRETGYYENKFFGFENKNEDLKKDERKEHLNKAKDHKVLHLVPVKRNKNTMKKRNSFDYGPLPDISLPDDDSTILISNSQYENMIQPFDEFVNVSKQIVDGSKYLCDFFQNKAVSVDKVCSHIEKLSLCFECMH